MDDNKTLPKPNENDDEWVTELLGRKPLGDYSIVLRRSDNSPVVIKNSPILESGRPMPTLYWLVDKGLNVSIGRLESVGGVKEAEAAVEWEDLQSAHQRYAALRSKLIDEGHSGPKPSGGVGGTRQGVKCLHAHYAYYLVDRDDPVGAWVHKNLAEKGEHFEQDKPIKES